MNEKILYIILPIILVLGIYGIKTSDALTGYFEPYNVKASNDAMTISIDNSTYKQGQIIHIYGKVTHYSSGVTVVIQITDPAKFHVTDFHALIDRYGIFTSSFTIPMTSHNGKYLITAYYEGDPNKKQLSLSVNISNKLSQVYIFIPLGASSEGSKVNFNPSAVVVQKGTTVVFTNDDNALHTVISGKVFDNGTFFLNDLFKGGFVYPGSSLEIAPTPGNYTYFCKIHPWLGGFISIKNPTVPAKPVTKPATKPTTPVSSNHTTTKPATTNHTTTKPTTNNTATKPVTKPVTPVPANHTTTKPATNHTTTKPTTNNTTTKPVTKPATPVQANPSDVTGATGAVGATGSVSSVQPNHNVPETTGYVPSTTYNPPHASNNIVSTIWNSYLNWASSVVSSLLSVNSATESNLSQTSNSAINSQGSSTVSDNTLILIWQERKDLQKSYPEVAKGNLTNLKTWATTTGWNEDKRLAALAPPGKTPK